MAEIVNAKGRNDEIDAGLAQGEGKLESSVLGIGPEDLAAHHRVIEHD